MKRLLYLLLIVACLPQSSFAQEYEYWHFLEEGKRWVYDYENMDSSGRRINATKTIYFVEDKKEKTKTVIERDDSSGYEWVMGEIEEWNMGPAGSRVYIIIEDDCAYHYYRIYDFSLEVDYGFILTIPIWGMDVFAWKKVSEAEVTIRGRKTRLHILECPFTRNPRDVAQNVNKLYWFDGIGSIRGFNPATEVVALCESKRFKACYVGDELIATYEDLLEAIGEVEGRTAVENIKYDRDSFKAEGIYDMQGRRLKDEPEHGLFIKNGDKFVK